MVLAGNAFEWQSLSYNIAPVSASIKTALLERIDGDAGQPDTADAGVSPEALCVGLCEFSCEAPCEAFCEAPVEALCEAFCEVPEDAFCVALCDGAAANAGIQKVIVIIIIITAAYMRQKP